MSMQAVFWSGGIVLVAYLWGGVPFGLLIGLARGVDIRTRGSGNIGATNAGRVLGWKYGCLAFILDMAKGLVPTLLAGLLLHGLTESGRLAGATTFILWVVAAGACIAGHMFPVYLNFRGGKGVATSLGVLLGIYPYFTGPGLLAFALWALTTWISRYVSLGSIVAAAAFPIIFAAFSWSRRDVWGDFTVLWPLHVFATIMAVVVIYRHRSNIQRLWTGTESKIGGSRETSG